MVILHNQEQMVVNKLTLKQQLYLLLGTPGSHQLLQKNMMEQHWTALHNLQAYYTSSVGSSEIQTMQDLLLVGPPSMTNTNLMMELFWSTRPSLSTARRQGWRSYASTDTSVSCGWWLPSPPTILSNIQKNLQMKQKQLQLKH